MGLTEGDLKTYVRSLLRSYALRPSRKLGQHFLVDERAVRMFVSTVEPGSTAYEIGCGLGSLTIPLAARASYVLCSELDERLARILSSVLEKRGCANVDIVVADALTFQLSASSYIVVSNTPFNISSALIVKLCYEKGLKYAVLGVQRELGLRLLAKPGESDYGRLSVIASLCFKIDKLFGIPATSYLPRPEVGTLVVKMVPSRYVPDDTLHAVEVITRRLFSLRNKRMAKALAEAFGVEGSGLTRLLANCRISPGQRVYETTPEQFLCLALEGLLTGFLGL